MTRDVSSGAEPDFDTLLESYTNRIRLGESIDVEEEAARWACYAPEIRELLPVILQLEAEKASRASAAKASPNDRWQLGTLADLGDYELLREIGRGGMGIIYDGRQRSVDRRVAVKVLRDDLANDPRSLARFQREARLAGSLQHPHIVQIFGTGSHHGTSFIVMQLVDGVGLDAIIRALRSGDDENVDLDSGSVQGMAEDTIEPTVRNEALVSFRDESTGRVAWDRFAATAAQLASALDYAHGKQIVHRDIKPANILIDRKGKPWLADFGLAQPLVHGSEITRIAGTLGYMAPEQIEGNACPQSDLYSLGVVFQELAVALCHRPGPVSSARHGDGMSVDDVDRIAEAKIVSQRSVEGQSEVPADLQRILSRCTAKQLDQRYFTAEALLSDLTCFIHGEPLESFQVSLAARSRHWIRHNPALASGLLVTFLSVVLALFFTLMAWRSEFEQRQRAESTLQLSTQALDRVYERLVPDVESGRLITPRNAELLDDLLASYEQLSQLEGSTTELQEKIAEATFRAGEINRRLGRWEQANDYYQRAIEGHRRIAKAEPIRAAAANLVVVRSMIGQSQCYPPDSPRFRSRLEDVLGALEAWDGDDGNADRDATLQFRFEKARVLYLLGDPPRRAAHQFVDDHDNKLIETGERSAEYLGRAIAILESWSQPQPTQVRSLLARCYNARSTAFGDRDHQQSVAILESLALTDPAAESFRVNLVDVLSDIDPLTLDRSRLPAAITSLRQALLWSHQLDLSDRRTRRIVQHTYHKLALAIREWFKSATSDRDVIATILGSPVRNPLDESIRYARLADQTRGLPGESVDTTIPAESVGSEWFIRFRITLCELLWERDGVGDRDEVRALVTDTNQVLGTIELRTQRGRDLANLLAELNRIVR